MEDKETELPWYLKKTPFLTIAFCFAPLAYILVLLNWNRVDKETKGDRFFVASILFLIFSIGFMPSNFLSISLAIGVVLFLCSATYVVLSRKQ
ncbi:hypothetical protein CSV72_16290 [Sporosarcina sp. P20a]|uniref:hypothetical protein n=1 Tax=Sporosarcina sp. P20a TaxID=2048256 RepID=UPI000C16A794|nr:hypothetical protein [Sporosarcina sp. P20a]PIC84924.1 hypothetical protein CSV72_16290 [Sporosarcina sp. P20a]